MPPRNKKTIYDKQNIHDPLIKLSFGRHGQKNPITGNLTKKGKKDARQRAKKINPKKVFKAYTSSEKRAQQTLEMIKENIKPKYKSAVKKELNENNAFVFSKNTKKIIDFFKNLAGNNKFAKRTANKWLNHKISAKIMRAPEEVADEVIRKRIGLVVRFIRLKESQGKIKETPKIHMEAITHAGIIMPVYERLTGYKYFEKYNDMPNVKETLTFNFSPYKKGEVKILMNFRKRNFDVTEKVYEILKQQKVL